MADEGAGDWVQAWLCVLCLYGGCLVLHLVIPETPVDGYVYDPVAQRPLQYRNNGLKVHLALTALAILLVSTGFVDGAFLYKNFWSCVAASCFYGIALAFVLFCDGMAALAADNKNKKNGAKASAFTIDQNACTPTTSRKVVEQNSSEFVTRSTLEHFYCGFRFNPRPSLIGGADIKMMLYVLGANMLHLVILSAMYHHATAMREIGAAGVTLPFLGGAATVPLSRAMLVYVALFSWFICEYLFYENVHAFTYDIFRERVGAKLVWGCFCFYPFFYLIGVWSIADYLPLSAAEDLSTLAVVGCVVVFFGGWVLTRGANLQKHAFRVNPDATEFSFPLFLGLLRVPQRRLSADGPGSRVLVSGFWGVSRHVNYLGEIMQALALALPGFLATGSFLPLLYPLYYIGLFLPRQSDDDKICAEKYGEKVWAEYMRQVPYRIIPGVF